MDRLADAVDAQVDTAVAERQNSVLVIDDSADNRLTVECVCDLAYLALHYRFNLDTALAHLEQLGRRVAGRNSVSRAHVHTPYSTDSSRRLWIPPES